MKHELQIRNIECYAFHGCIEEEGLIGSRFSVDLDLELDFSQAVEKDELKYTPDYVVLHNLVREEMAIRSKLIEHVAGRILKRLQKMFPDASLLRVSVTKYNPPVNGQLGKAIVVLTT
jgi:7,8-dihydroneopterin aldolase/epimerase/oxygenase